MNTKKYYQIGITGHRDLLPSQYEENLTILKGHLLKLKREHSNKQLIILTPLAEGADRLIAKVALDINIPYKVILPMPKRFYIKDFSKKSQKEFEYYLKQAQTIKTIPLFAGNTLELISKDSVYRSFQYKEAGRIIVEKADEMIIMSDGKENDKMGGTQDIANYAQAYGTILYKIQCDRQCV
jgi:hypothetical protein